MGRTQRELGRSRKETPQNVGGVRVCPRCGSRISWVERRVVGDRVYYYAVHVFKEVGGGLGSAI